MVGLIPLFAVETLEPELIDRLPGFKRACSGSSTTGRSSAATWPRASARRRRAAAAVDRAAGRSSCACCTTCSTARSSCPRTASARSRACIATIPTCSASPAPSIAWTTSRPSRRPALFGGNSNWRGPIWFPVNFLLIESLQKFHHFFGDDLKVECPTGSSRLLNLWEVAAELSRGLTRLFTRGRDGRRPIYGSCERFQTDPHWRDLILFYEYFHGDDGAASAPTTRRAGRAGRQAHRAERRVTRTRGAGSRWTPRVRRVRSG
jgi:hypothetical protein